MDADTYQSLALRTGIDTPSRPKRSVDVRLTNAALGIAGEAGEFAEHIKKLLYHGKPLDADAAAKELGDVLWYCALAADALGLTLSQVMEMNVAKLKARWPEGFQDG